MLDQPDRMVMALAGLGRRDCRLLAQQALGNARRLAPKLSGSSANRMEAIYGEGWIGIRWLDCVAVGNRVLRSDWRWVPVEDLVVGDALIAFDEEITSIEPGMRGRGRRYRTAKVEQHNVEARPCVEVRFNDGTTTICTEQHPWLANRGQKKLRRWINAQDLKPGDGAGVYFDPWVEDRSYEAGWLAGMFDGEGSLAHNGTRNGVDSWCSGTLVVTQNHGPVLDRLAELLREFGYACGERRGQRRIGRLEILGGFAEQMRLLGTLRPERLVDKIRHEGRHMEALRERRVVEVIAVGLRDVAVMGTSTQTYLVEGMAAHNSHVWFQERGVRPFTMTKLAGKLIPMWIDDPTGRERAKSPKAQTRTTASGKTQVLIFRKAAKIGARRMVKRNDAFVNVPASYPGAPGRIDIREAPSPHTSIGKVGGQIAKGNIGVRWRFPGMQPRKFLEQGLLMSAYGHGLVPGPIHAVTESWRGF